MALCPVNGSKPDMTNVVSPGERFTLWLNSDGKPVEKLLAEMTAGEVLAAINWQRNEQKRLDRIAAPWRKMAEELSRGIKPINLTEEEWRKGIAALEASTAAHQKLQQLMRLVYAAMPQWRATQLNFGEALRRYWPRQ